MRLIRNLFIFIILPAILIIAGLLGYAWNWSNQAIELDKPSIEYMVKHGSSPRKVVKILNQAGVNINETGFLLLSRYMQVDTKLKAGSYQVNQGETPIELINRMASGDVLQASVTIIEGWTYKRIRQALKDNQYVNQTLNDVEDDELLKMLDINHTSAEGLFYPDTYVFSRGTDDFDILKWAYNNQIKILNEVWQLRDANLPLKTPYEALIMASIIEKETGHGEDRGKISGVFSNRLNINMALQTDPTVIYGMGDAYQGRIRKKDLQTDTPWNTYTRAGLPPTPIASAGYAALLAAVQPDEHKYLYFVSRGDGTSQFSRNLNEHNRAVAKYILGKGRK